MITLKPWEQSRTTYSSEGNIMITHDYSTNQVTIPIISEIEIISEVEEKIKFEETKKIKTK